MKHTLKSLFLFSTLAVANGPNFLLNPLASGSGNGGDAARWQGKIYLLDFLVSSELYLNPYYDTSLAKHPDYDIYFRIVQESLRSFPEPIQKDVTLKLLEMRRYSSPLALLLLMGLTEFNFGMSPVPLSPINDEKLRQDFPEGSRIQAASRHMDEILIWEDLVRSKEETRRMEANNLPGLFTHELLFAVAPLEEKSTITDGLIQKWMEQDSFKAQSVNAAWYQSQSREAKRTAIQKKLQTYKFFQPTYGFEQSFSSGILSGPHLFMNYLTMRVELCGTENQLFDDKVCFPYPPDYRMTFKTRDLGIKEPEAFCDHIRSLNFYKYQQPLRIAVRKNRDEFYPRAYSYVNKAGETERSLLYRDDGGWSDPHPQLLESIPFKRLHKGGIFRKELCLLEIKKAFEEHKEKISLRDEDTTL